MKYIYTTNQNVSKTNTRVLVLTHLACFVVGSLFMAMWKGENKIVHKIEKVNIKVVEKIIVTPTIPAPTIPPVASITGGTVEVGMVEGLIVKYFGDEAPVALAIARAESGLRCGAVSPTNTNGTTDHGLFQINDIHKSKFQGSMYDCEENIKVAKQIRDSWHGWNAWSVYNSGRYQQFLSKGGEK